MFFLIRVVNSQMSESVIGIRLRLANLFFVLLYAHIGTAGASEEFTNTVGKYSCFFQLPSAE